MCRARGGGLWRLGRAEWSACRRGATLTACARGARGGPGGRPRRRRPSLTRRATCRARGGGLWRLGRAEWSACRRGQLASHAPEEHAEVRAVGLVAAAPRSRGGLLTALAGAAFGDSAERSGVPAAEGNSRRMRRRSTRRSGRSASSPPPLAHAAGYLPRPRGRPLATRPSGVECLPPRATRVACAGGARGGPGGRPRRRRPSLTRRATCRARGGGLWRLGRAERSVVRRGHRPPHASVERALSGRSAAVGGASPAGGRRIFGVHEAPGHGEDAVEERVGGPELLRREPSH